MAASHESERFSGSDTELRLPSQWSTAQGISNEEEGSPAEEPMRACSQASVLTAQWAPNPSDHIIHRIASWDGALNLHTIAMSLDNGMVQVHHYAQVTVIIPEQDITAKQISLPMVLRNGPKSQPTMNLKPGQNTLSFVDDVPVSCGQEADIAIIRDVQDLKAPLHLYFSSTYTLKERHIAVPIPSLRPQTGKLRSESIYIAVSYPPLTTKPFTRQEFSTWKLGCDTTSQVTHYERTPLLRLYPERFSDDLRVHITDPDPVSFRSLEDLHPSDVIWDFNMSVERQLGIDFSCRMSLVLHVGEANRLLNVDSHGWIPEYSIINGRLATHEWRKGNGATLFKQPGMINGPLKVDFVWHKPRNCGGFIFALPRVMDLKILPGKMTCKIDRCKMHGRSLNIGTC